MKITIVFKHFIKTNCLDSAIILSYSTLLTLVPILYLSLSVFSISPVFEGYRELVSEFIFHNFLPNHYDVAQRYLTLFIEKTANLTGLGVSFLIITALLLLFEVDKRINLIWHNSHKRHWFKGTISYLLVLFIGPFLLASSLLLNAYLIKLNIQDSQTFLNAWMPSVLSILGFALLYYFTPIAKVSFKNALKAGLLSAILLEGLKSLVSLYVAYFPSYEIIYGALAIFPLFILWIYLAWIILLLGATYVYILESKGLK